MQPPKAAQALTPEHLRRTCDPSTIKMPKTADIEMSQELIGQNRAINAIELAVSSHHRDFNVFVQGKPGSGRHSAIQRSLDQHAQNCAVPDDWVYVNNFDMPDRPRALRLPPGVGLELKHAMESLVDDLANDIPALFESEEYQAQRHAIERRYTEEHETAMSALNDKARAKDTAILRTPMGVAVAATRNGEVIEPKDYEALPAGEQEEIKATVTEIQQELEAIMADAPRSERAQRKEIRDLNAAMMTSGVEERIGEIASSFDGVTGIATYLEEVRADVADNADLFLMAAMERRNGNFPLATTKHYEDPRFQRYLVAVMVSHRRDDESGAPVVVEDFPTLANLIGRIEHSQEMGALLTDFTMIKPGALHRANGGFLVLDARQVLSEPFAWETLKRCLKSEAISIISVGEKLSLATTTSLSPDPIPLNVRVILIGERLLYHLLVKFDPDFSNLFKIQADFSDEIPISDINLSDYVHLIVSLGQGAGLLPLDEAATARLIEESARLAEDAERLTLNLGRLSDILKEADYQARTLAKTTIQAIDIDGSIGAAESRAGRIRDLSEEQILRGSKKIATDGDAIGQINALSVIDLGSTRFGQPSRITARVRMGAGKVVDIEREVELGGPLHSKGVMILSGFLSAHYAQDLPISLWASIAFEQSYGGVDGDSASAAELFALLSALSDLPIDQSYAVTGSVNQFGEVQAIGGVNEKIEGFFDICAARGLTGRQGVLIPLANVKNLALRDRVIDAVKRDKFRIIPLETIDQGISILTGRAAGRRDEQGAYAEDTVNGLVERKLQRFAEQRRKFGGPSDVASASGKEKTS
ncbi:MAG: AAA family ATPase [Pseudomonadota bacterium]